MKKEKAIACATGVWTALFARLEEASPLADKAVRAPTIRKFRIVQTEGNWEVECLVGNTNFACPACGTTIKAVIS